MLVFSNDDIDDDLRWRQWKRISLSQNQYKYWSFINWIDQFTKYKRTENTQNYIFSDKILSPKMAVDSAQQTQLAKNTNQQGMKTFIRLACRISKKARSCIHRNKKQQSTSTSSSSSNKLTTATTTPTTTLTTPPKMTKTSTEQCSNKKNSSWLWFSLIVLRP